jgi:hypothetical protein
MNAKHKGGPDGYAKAMAIFTSVLATNPKDALALRGKAWIEAEQGQSGQAAAKEAAKADFKAFLLVSKDKKQNALASAALKRLK